MTTITNTEYEDALNIVANKERSLLVDTADSVAAAAVTLKDITDELAATLASLPRVIGAQSVARANVENAYNQVQSFYSQLQYLTDTFDSLKAQYETPEVTE